MQKPHLGLWIAKFAKEAIAHEIKSFVVSIRLSFYSKRLRHRRQKWGSETYGEAERSRVPE